MAGATDADADKQKGAWMRDDTRKRSAGGHIGYSESTSCRPVHAWDNYYSYSGFYQKIRGWRWIENWRIWSGERACTYICLHRRKGRYAGMHLFSLPYTIEYWSASSKKKLDDGFCFMSKRTGDISRLTDNFWHVFLCVCAE